jgi:uncharacterized membrane protein
MNTFRISLFLCLCLLATTLSSCEIVGDIFKAGAYTGIIGVVVILLLVFWLINKMRRRG